MTSPPWAPVRERIISLTPWCRVKRLGCYHLLSNDPSPKGHTIHFMPDSGIEENQNQDPSVIVLGSTHELSNVEVS